MTPNLLKSISVPVTVLSLCTFSTAERAYGLLLDPIQAGIVTELIVPDTELLLLSQFVGTSGDQLTLTSTITSVGSTGTASGMYLGQPVSINFSADSSAFPAGPIMYATTGFYGSLPWSGNGTLLFTPTSTGFLVDYDGSLNIGSHSGLIEVQNTAVEVGANIMSATTTGTITANGEVNSVELGWDCGKNPKVGDICEDGTFINNKWAVFSLAEFVASVPPSGVVLRNRYGGTPEPSTALMALAGAVGIVGYACRQRMIK